MNRGREDQRGPCERFLAAMNCYIPATWDVYRKNVEIEHTFNARGSTTWIDAIAVNKGIEVKPRSSFTMYDFDMLNKADDHSPISLSIVLWPGMEHGHTKRRTAGYWRLMAIRPSEHIKKHISQSVS